MLGLLSVSMRACMRMWPSTLLRAACMLAAQHTNCLPPFLLHSAAAVAESLNFRFVKQDAERVVLDPLRHPSHDWALGLLTLPQGEGQVSRVHETRLQDSSSAMSIFIPRQQQE